MELKNAFIKTNELVDDKILQNKNDVLNKPVFTGLTLNLFIYIEAVFALKEPTIGDLAKYLEVTNASASIAVQKLIDGGYFTKQQSLDDKRVYNIYPTGKCKKLMRSYSEGENKLWDRLISPLNESEQMILSNAFAKIIISQKKDINS